MLLSKWSFVIKLPNCLWPLLVLSVKGILGSIVWLEVQRFYLLYNNIVYKRLDYVLHYNISAIYNGYHKILPMVKGTLRNRHAITMAMLFKS